MLVWKTYIYEVKSIGLSTRKGRKPQTLLDAARHNLREIQAENGADYGKIDPSRIHLNEILIGPSTAKKVVEDANQIFIDAGVDFKKLRKDYNQASEHVFSLQRGQDEGDFFRVIADGAKMLFGADKVLSFVVHRDQSNPHAHMLVSPISNGKYCGSKLHSHEPLERLKKHFRANAETIGFRPASDSKLRRTQLTAEAADVIAYLEYVCDPLMFHPMWPLISPCIVANPKPFHDYLNLASFDIPRAVSQDRFVSRQCESISSKTKASELFKGKNLPCVGFQETTTSTFLGRSMPVAREEKEITVVREEEMPTENYNYDTGEFFQSHRLGPPGRSEADDWVKREISRMPWKEQ